MNEEGGGQQPAVTSRRVPTHRTQSSWPGGGGRQASSGRRSSQSCAATASVPRSRRGPRSSESRPPHWTARHCRQSETSPNPITHTGLHVTADRARRHLTPSPTLDCTSQQTERYVTKPSSPTLDCTSLQTERDVTKPRPPHWTARHRRQSETSPNPVTHSGLHVTADR